LTDDGFKVQSSVAGDKGTVIQAKKESFLRDLVDADRAFTITITGDPSDFTVRFGVGKWIQHLGVAALEALLVAEIFLIVDIADSAWSLEVEDKIITDMKGFIG
jgi:hypothetical protein